MAVEVQLGHDHQFLIVSIFVHVGSNAIIVALNQAHLQLGKAGNRLAKYARMLALQRGQLFKDRFDLFLVNTLVVDVAVIKILRLADTGSTLDQRIGQMLGLILHSQFHRRGQILLGLLGIGKECIHIGNRVTVGAVMLQQRLVDILTGNTLDRQIIFRTDIVGRQAFRNDFFIQSLGRPVVSLQRIKPSFTKAVFLGIHAAGHKLIQQLPCPLRIATGYQCVDQIHGIGTVSRCF